MYMELGNPCRKENGYLRVKGDLSAKVVIILCDPYPLQCDFAALSSKDKNLFLYPFNLNLHYDCSDK